MSVRLDHRIGLVVHRALARPFFARPKTLMLFGTMRSGSTLLSNVLLSNPEITGFGESHLVYDTPRRLLDLRYWTFRYTHRYPGSGMRLFDKVLHNSYTPDLPALMAQSETQSIMLLRNPADTEKSIRKMILKLRPERLEHTDIWELLEERYLYMSEMLDQIPHSAPVAALRYEALLADPDAVLAGVSDFLGLRHPLSASYELPRWGGRWGLGDGSAKLRSGEIAPRPRNAEDDPENVVPPKVTVAFDQLCTRCAARTDQAWL